MKINHLNRNDEVLIKRNVTTLEGFKISENTLVVITGADYEGEEVIYNFEVKVDGYTKEVSLYSFQVEEVI